MTPFGSPSRIAFGIEATWSRKGSLPDADDVA